jgi:hypothetical protein
MMADPYNSTFNMGYFPCGTTLMLTMQKIVYLFQSGIVRDGAGSADDFGTD